jgi:hypothetical protein
MNSPSSIIPSITPPVCLRLTCREWLRSWQVSPLMGPTLSIMVVKVRRTAHLVLVAGARSESGVSPRLGPGGGALAFEQLEDALRVLPDRADVAEHQLGRSVLRHPL